MALPVAGAFRARHSWRVFRRRFDALRLSPMLDYAAYRSGSGGRFRFIGGFESLDSGKKGGEHILWIRGEELTVSVALGEAWTYVFPMLDLMEDNEKSASGIFDPGNETPERIRWDQVANLTEGARVYVGGMLQEREGRLRFESRRDEPLLVIFYDGGDFSLTTGAIRAGRMGNEYFNSLTPYGIILGVFALLFMAVNYLSRPAFRLTLAANLIALFIPVLPLIPPGMFFSLIYRRLWWRARVYRVYRDLVMLPESYLAGDSPWTFLPDGELYHRVYREEIGEELRREIQEREIPMLSPEGEGRPWGWYFYGAGDGNELPGRPLDPLATYGVVPGEAKKMARRFTLRAYSLEILSWLLLVSGIALNILFIAVILRFFTVL